jgi:hypothetical protein
LLGLASHDKHVLVNIVGDYLRVKFKLSKLKDRDVVIPDLLGETYYVWDRSIQELHVGFFKVRNYGK